MKTGLQEGVIAALIAAFLFGASTPLAKMLLAHTGPWLLAALLYLGSGTGLWIVRRLRRTPPVSMARGDWGWLTGAIVMGGIAGPVLLLMGLAAMPASGASLLLNAEGVLTALLAWFAFKENFDRRILLGMSCIVAGAMLLTVPDKVEFAGIWPALAILAACFAWAVDNNLTRKVSLSDATFIAMIKGLVAGLTNLVLALAMLASWPGGMAVTGAMLLGFAGYGASLTLFVTALRHLGAARTGAYFSVAPFFGAALSIVLLGEPVTSQLAMAAVLMAIGVWLHLTETHVHEHVHEALEHTHEHIHDDGHHLHDHGQAVLPGTRHSHFHRHEPARHAHAHFPDAHHQHSH